MRSKLSFYVSRYFLLCHPVRCTPSWEEYGDDVDLNDLLMIQLFWKYVAIKLFSSKSLTIYVVT